MTTPAAPQDPGALPLPAANVVRTPTNFEAPLAEWGGKVRTGIQALRSLLEPGGLLGTDGRLEQSYIVEPGGIPAGRIADGAAVKIEGAKPLRVMVLTQSMYDAIVTKSIRVNYKIVSQAAYNEWNA